MLLGQRMWFCEVTEISISKNISVKTLSKYLCELKDQFKIQDYYVCLFSLSNDTLESSDLKHISSKLKRNKGR